MVSWHTLGVNMSPKLRWWVDIFTLWVLFFLVVWIKHTRYFCANWVILLDFTLSYGHASFHPSETGPRISSGAPPWCRPRNKTQSHERFPVSDSICWHLRFLLHMRPPVIPLLSLCLPGLFRCKWPATRLHQNPLLLRPYDCSEDLIHLHREILVRSIAKERMSHTLVYLSWSLILRAGLMSSVTATWFAKITLLCWNIK